MSRNRDMLDCGRGIVRFSHQGRVRYGLVSGGRLRLYEGSPFSGGQVGKQTAPLNEVRLLAPCRPSKVVAVGLNYKAHAKEVNKALPAEPMIFMKPSTSVIGPGDKIVRPAISQRVDHESELGVVMGRQCRLVGPDEAKDYILGYTCLNDVTARDLQARDGQYTRGKGFDTFCPLGPVIALDLDPTRVQVKAVVNGETRQDTNTSDMIFDVYQLVSFVSQVMTLKPGDVIATGTPSGIGPLQAGDVVAIEVQGVGVLENPVV
ncbi:MAG: fumarylacetoacetate hydrolase family protein [Proteobacteria bacterium]|nr:fumarylacetoacetate hydrolase family protein [Pseudomonadota bacterium]MBU1450024.1 fumarylacetoacetate hydrolase family protein [Pseudomonadota bacterium]MBU2470626.1 fumarylacetoacetate hydrolase family protein [Pseudomonadota bacterium]MBU2516645.1 fumarylacetoacetate hydrolase family protein [Pseudomonadota bacterium]